MTLTINDTTMTSDQTPHTARQAPSRNGWQVSWLPGRTLDRNSAITAMVLAGQQGLGQGGRGRVPVGDPVARGHDDHVVGRPTARFAVVLWPGHWPASGSAAGSAAGSGWLAAAVAEASADWSSWTCARS